MIPTRYAKRNNCRPHSSKDERNQNGVNASVHNVPPSGFGCNKMHDYPSPRCQHPNKSENERYYRNVSFPTHGDCVWWELAHVQINLFTRLFTAKKNVVCYIQFTSHWIVQFRRCNGWRGERFHTLHPFLGHHPIVRTISAKTRPLKVDGAILRWKSEELLRKVQERYQTKNLKPKIDAAQLESINRKLDLIAGYVAKLSGPQEQGTLPCPHAFQVIEGGTD